MLARLSSLVATLSLACACGTPAPRTAASLVTPSTCEGSLEDVSAREDPALGVPAPAAEVREVRTVGSVSVPTAILQEAIALEAGAMLDEATIRADIRRLLRLGVFEDVQVQTEHVDGGVRVSYELLELPLIATAELIGEGGEPARHRVERLAGEVFRPGRLHRLAQKIASDRRRDGFAEATTDVAARRGDEGVAVCVVVDAGRRWVIDTLALEGNEAIDDDALLAVMATLDGRVNADGGIYRADLIEEDQQRMLALYFDAGHVAARIRAPRTRWDGDALTVTIPVEEGPVYTLRELRVTGDLTGPASEYVAFLDLEVGVPFDRSAIAGALDRLRERERARGNISVFPLTELDEEGHFVDLEVQVEDLDAADPPERGDHETPRLIDRELSGPDPSLAPPEAP